MAWSITIAGSPIDMTIASDRRVLGGAIDVEESVYGASVCSFTMVVPLGDYRPAKRDEVIILDGATRKFAGLVDVVQEKGVLDEPGKPILLQIDCVSFHIYAEWVHVVNGGFPAGTTLITALTALQGGLAGFGVTLDPSQVTGPALPLLGYDVRSYTSILDELREVTGYIWEIDYNKVLRAFLPSTTAAPFNVTTEDENAAGDIRVRTSDGDYANRLIVSFGSGQREIIDDFTGDGVTTAYAINYFPMIANRGYINVGGTMSGNEPIGGVNETLSINATPTLATWDYNTTTGVVTRIAPVANGVAIHFVYTAQFPVSFTLNNTSEQPPVIARVLQLPDVFLRPVAVSRGQTVLDGLSAEPRIIEYSTYISGLRPGTSQTVTVPKRNFNASVTITDIRTVHVEGDLVRYDVTCIESDFPQLTWRDIYREWSELGGGGGNAAVGATTVTSSGPGAPDTAVQFNRNGSFGGDAAFTYIEESDSVICGGGGSSITAASFQSCQVFGSNCHIADP